MLRFRISASSAVFGLLATLVCLSGCTSEVDETSGQLWLVNGQETDTWTRDPVPQSLEVDLVGMNKTQLATVAAPTSAIDLGTGTPVETTAAFEVTGYDSSNEAVIHGKSVTYSVSTFANAAPVTFVGRTGEVSRAPDDLLSEYRHPLVEVVGHAYVLVAGGDLSSASQNPLDLYDAANWLVAGQQTWLTAQPKSWAVAGSSLLVINDDGASNFNFTADTVTAVTAPSGLDFADVVGGKTIVGPDDTRYIVGATRASGTATDSVLRVAPDGTLTGLTLTAPRLGAAAGMVNGQLIVAGGSDSAAGAEVLNATGTAFAALPFPADAVQGAALTQLDSTTALLAGGADASGTSGALRTLDLSCTDKCTAGTLPNLDFTFTNAQGFNLADEDVVLSGDSADGQTHLFTLQKTTDFALAELTLHTPRTNASLVTFPNGQVGLVGGDAVADGSPATSVELYFPPVTQ